MARPQILDINRKVLLATLVVLGTALLAAVVGNVVERSVLVVIGGLAVMALMLEWGVPALRNPQARAPILAGEAPRNDTDRDEFVYLTERLPQALLVLEGNMVIMANKAAKAALGNHIVGEDVRLVIRHPAAADLVMASTTQDPENPVERPVELVGVGGRDQRWEMCVFFTRPGRRIILLTDRSPFYAVEQMRTDFVANASHELRTPLASIKGFIETLEDEEAGADPKTRGRFLKVMFREANRMQKLIEDLMSLSRIEADKFRLPDVSVNLGTIARDLQDLFLSSHDHRGSDIVLDIADDLPEIQGDAPQLAQLMHNLVENSLKYGRPGTPVTLSLHPSRNRSMVRLTVSDEGEGIPEEHLPRLTERFYRVDSGRSRAMGGTGLGLAIVKHIVERHRGRLDIRSVAQKGTTIIASLPAGRASHMQSADRPESDERRQAEPPTGSTEASDIKV